MIMHHYLSERGKDLIENYLLSLPRKEEIDGRKVLEFMENDEWDKVSYKHWEGKIYEVKFYKFNRIFYVVKDKDNVYLLHACRKQKNKTEKRAELESEIPVCKINFQFSIFLARLNSGKLSLLQNSGSKYCKH